MVINEKQIMQLMDIASDYAAKIEMMIKAEITVGTPRIVLSNIKNLLWQITSQQSDKLKVIE